MDFLRKTDLEGHLVLTTADSDKLPSPDKSMTSLVPRTLSGVSRSLTKIDNALCDQNKTQPAIQFAAVLITSYCVPAVIFAIGRIVLLLHQVPKFDLRLVTQVGYTAASTFASLGVTGGIICFFVYRLLIRTKLPAPFPLIIALLCSFLLPVLNEIFRDFNDTLVASKLGSGMDFIVYQFFVYMPQVWGLGGLAGGISAMASLLLIHPFKSLELLLGKDKGQAPLLESKPIQPGS